MFNAFEKGSDMLQPVKDENSDASILKKKKKVLIR